MNPSIQELNDSNKFKLIAEIDILNPNPFFKEFAKGFITTIFLISLCLGFGFFVGFLSMQLIQGKIIASSVFYQFISAFFFMFLILLPTHEGIHAITYWLKGAKEIRFSKANKSFAVFTMANHHVVNLKEYPILAITPFLVISLLISFLFYLYSAYLVFFVVLLIIHSFACIGDVILINFAFNNWNKIIYNFDDFTLKKSYFFEKII
jgi:hypothetical protein